MVDDPHEEGEYLLGDEGPATATGVNIFQFFFGEMLSLMCILTTTFMYIFLVCI